MADPGTYRRSGAGAGHVRTSQESSKKPSHRQKGRRDGNPEEELSDEGGSDYEEEDGDEDEILGANGEDSDSNNESAVGAVKRRRVEVEGGAISERSTYDRSKLHYRVLGYCCTHFHMYLIVSSIYSSSLF